MKVLGLHLLGIFALGFFTYANYGVKNAIFVITFYIIFSLKDFVFSKIKSEKLLFQFLKQKSISLSFLGGIIIGLILSISLLLLGFASNYIFFGMAIICFCMCLLIQYSFFLRERSLNEKIS